MDPEELDDEVRLAAHAQVLPEQQITGRVEPDPDADLTGSSWLDDLLSAGRGALPSDRTAAADRLVRRARRVLTDPGATLLGLTDGATMGWSDELGGIFGSHPAQPGGVSRTGMRTEPAIAYEDVRDRIRAAQSEAEERNPDAYSAGETAGMLAPLLFSGGEAAALESPGALATIGRGAAEGAGFGALAGAGESDATGVDLARDTATSALLGGAMGGVLSTVPAGARAARARAPRAQAEADLARVASVGGGRGTISRTDPRIAEFARLPGGISGQAARIRRLGSVGPLDSIARTAERSQEVLDRVADTGAMAETRQRLADAGHQAPVTAITDALEAEAQRLEGMASTRPYAQRARDLARQFVDTYGAEGTIPYDQAIRELGQLSGEVPWQSERLAADAARGRRHAIRDSLDTWIEGLLGPDEAARYREGRLDYQTARTAADQARARAESAAGNRGISLTDTIAAAGGQSLTGGLARLLLNRGWRMHEPALRATGAETLARLLSSVPELATRGGLDQLAGRVSPELLAALQGAQPQDTTTEAPTTEAPAEDDGGFVPDEDEGGFIPDEETAP